MKMFFKYLLTGLKYLIIQSSFEIVIIVIGEYFGFKVLPDFSKNNLFVENVEGVAWAISMKAAIFSLIYLPLFAIICYLWAGTELKTKLMFGIVNALLDVTLLTILVLLKHLDFQEGLPPFVSTVIASLIIIVIIVLTRRKT